MTRSDAVCAFIRKYCRVPEGEHVGKPIELAPFQIEFIKAIYDKPTRRAILSVGRKNGKTALIACLVLAHLIGPMAVQSSQIISAALSREQAALVFNLAAKMVGMHPQLSELVRVIPSGKRLIGLPMNVEYRAISAESKTAMGLSPVLLIGDEWGQVRGTAGINVDFIDALLTSQGAHANPLQIIISTQAARDSDWLSVQLDYDDPSVVRHLYTAPESCDLMDEAAWKAANPALGKFRSLRDLRDQMQQAQRMPAMENSARNLLLNQRVSTDAPFVSPNVWKACGAKPVEFDGPVYGGLDLSARTDLTALVLVGQVDGVWQIQPHFWTPQATLMERARHDRAPYDVWTREGYMRATPGASIDYEVVAADMLDIVADVDLVALAFDRWRMDVLKKELDRMGAELPLVEWGQGYKDMAPALDALEAELLNERMAHGMHPVLTWCAANATVTTDPAGGRKLDKSRSNGRIDGMQALAMAMGVAARQAEEATYDADQFMFV